MRNRTGPGPGVKATYPGFIEPALATSIGKPPAGDRWVHEVKFDGYRVQLHIQNSSITLFTRNGYDWTDRFKKIADQAWHINAKSAIIDGEIVVPSSDGTTDFAVLQKELRSKRASDKITMYAFDLLYLNGFDLRALTLIERKAELAKLIGKTNIHLSEHFQIDSAMMFKRVCEIGFEGIVSKLADGRYRSDRTGDWLRVTCRQRETLPIVGYAIKANKFDGLILGRTDGKNLIYAGKVDHGFTRESEQDVRSRLKPLVQKAQAFTRKIKKPNATWVKPSLLAEIEDRAKSAEGKLRHPSFKGIREDL